MKNLSMKYKKYLHKRGLCLVLYKNCGSAQWLVVDQSMEAKSASFMVGKIQDVLIFLDGD